MSDKSEGNRASWLFFKFANETPETMSKINWLKGDWLWFRWIEYYA